MPKNNEELFNKISISIKEAIQEISHQMTEITGSGADNELAWSELAVQYDKAQTEQAKSMLLTNFSAEHKISVNMAARFHEYHLLSADLGYLCHLDSHILIRH